MTDIAPPTIKITVLPEPYRSAYAAALPKVRDGTCDDDRGHEIASHVTTPNLERFRLSVPNTKTSVLIAIMTDPAVFAVEIADKDGTTDSLSVDDEMLLELAVVSAAATEIDRRLPVLVRITSV